MVGSRTAAAVLGLFAGLVVSIAVWYDTGSLLLFLLVPFVPFCSRASAGIRIDRKGQID